MVAALSIIDRVFVGRGIPAREPNQIRRLQHIQSLDFYRHQYGPGMSITNVQSYVRDCELKDTNHIENDVLPLVEKDN